MIRRILVAVDGTEGSRQAAIFASGLAKQTGAHLTALLVLDPPSSLAIPALDVVWNRPVWPTPEQLEGARRFVETLGVPPAQLKIREELGHPAEVIIAQAEVLDVDLVVVGARGMTAAESWFMGSVSQKVARECKRPVTIAR